VNQPSLRPGSGNRATDRTKAQNPPANKESNLTTKTTTVMKEFVIIAALAIGIAVIPRREGKKKARETQSLFGWFAVFFSQKNQHKQ